MPGNLRDKGFSKFMHTSNVIFPSCDTNVLPEKSPLLVPLTISGTYKLSELGLIRTNRKCLFIRQNSVITNVLLVRMVCRDLTNFGQFGYPHDAGRHFENGAIFHHASCYPTTVLICLPNPHHFHIQTTALEFLSFLGYNLR